MYTTDSVIVLKDKLGIGLIILVIAWIVCNYLVKKFMIKYEEMNTLIDTIVKTRKTIFFEIIILLITYILRIRIFTVIAIIYYFTLTFMLFIVLFLSILEIMVGTDNRHNKELWYLFAINSLNMLLHFFTVCILGLVYKLI